MDLETYETVKEAFDRVFYLVSRFEKRQNDEFILMRKRLRKTLYRLKRAIKQNSEETIMAIEHKRPEKLKPLWLDII